MTAAEFRIDHRIRTARALGAYMGTCSTLATIGDQALQSEDSAEVRAKLGFIVGALREVVGQAEALESGAEVARA